ncbi:helix-turn-helix domain-containing protein [Nocardia cyriacigeorgica]|nr:helix-turn-helix domain-containing protein [Nocardia cyriacigeorgica]MBF6100322.1 helix-turn-helix domain-containing protein [Nocardia cyriacigeorgica]MBF6157487.1 helix-turn-helix domain-containing protein [Nocardia cyriacigeorgica]MBF6196458.1 helix-turn-helix domain-containing protein [Nocardia cyriacigeorgica]MBF6318290.1 helix-turn-helix domain-containing protein [Nocardia cyriacigeorgica]
MRKLRERAGISQSAAARAIELSPQSIGRIEEGHGTRVSSLQVNALCDRYAASDTDRRVLLGLLQEFRTAQKSGAGWWRAFADQLTAGFDHYLALEDAASRVTAWKTTIVPGLLQTSEYRRALAWAESPELDTNTIENFISAAARRQSRLDDPDFAMDVLLAESVLHEQTGGPAVMGFQLEHLARMSERPGISIRVVPFDAASHPGAAVGSFLMLEFPALSATKEPEPPVVYVECFSGDLYIEDERELGRYRTALARISRVALNPKQSRDRLREVAKEFQR